MASVFVSAWVGAGNLGDELLLRRLLGRLRAAGAEDITVVSLDPSATAALHRVVATHPRALVRSTRAIRRADLLIVGPGGLLQDQSSPFNLPYQLHRAMLARIVGTPVLGMGLGADPMERTGSGWLLRLGLGRAATVAVRDEPSVSALGAHRVAAMATADLALATPTPASPVSAGPLVVSLRPWRPGGRVPVRWQRHRLDDEQVVATARALDEAATAAGVTVRFVAFEPHTDHPLHRAIAERMDVAADCVVPTLDDLFDHLADATAVVATRFHAAVVGLVADRPVTAIGYAPKVRSLADEIGGSLPIVTDDAAGLAGLPDAVAASIAADGSERRAGLAALRAREAANAALIERALGR